MCSSEIVTAGMRIDVTGIYIIYICTICVCIYIHNVIKYLEARSTAANMAAFSDTLLRNWCGERPSGVV